MTSESRFVHLHVHTDHSLIDGLSLIDPLIERVAEQGYEAMAITDHGTLSGAIEFHEACAAHGVKPIIGAELYMAPGHRMERGANQHHMLQSTGQQQQHVQYHLTALAATPEGYRNLSKLSSLAYLEGFYWKPRVDFELLEQYNKGIIIGTGCLSSMVSRALQDDDERSALEIIDKFVSIFGRDRVFLECMNHGIPQEDKVSHALVDIAKSTGLRLVATNDSHYTYPDQALAHTGWLCTSYKKTLDNPEGAQFQGTGYWVRSREELEPLFVDIPGALDNTLEIASQIEPCVIPFSDPIWPSFPLDPPANNEQDQQRRERELLIELVERGARRRYGDTHSPDIDDRIHFELEVIQRMNAISYFLLVHDICQAARRLGIVLGPGRGSVVGSVVAYCLDIHQLDPLRYKLLFERFLNPQRVSMPDIDLDVPHLYRDQLIEYIKQRYGQDRVVQIAAFKVIGGRAAIRDAARLYKLPHAQLDGVLELYPQAKLGREYTLAECFTPGSTVYEQAAPLRAQASRDKMTGQVLSMARNFEGAKRDQLIHAAGVVICPGPSLDFAPLALRRSGAADGAGRGVCTQFNLHSLERLGLLKMDILGLKTLSAISECLRALKQSGIEPPDMNSLPVDDEATYNMISTGRTVGIFQMESASIQGLARLIRPANLAELSDLSALHRPGPMGTGQHVQYAKRKWGQEKVNYKHPDLEEVLGDTRGILIYQEQMMLMAQRMAGFSLAQADEMRRVCSKKIHEQVEHTRQQFVKGGVQLGHSEELMRQLFAEIEPFADYGFNRSHAYAYSLITYWTAYLKTHWPTWWMAALLNTHADSTDTDKYGNYITETKRMGIRLLPPLVGKADLWIKTIDHQSLALGLCTIRGVGEQTAKTLVEAVDSIKPDLTPQRLFGVMKATRGLNRSLADTLLAVGALHGVAAGAPVSEIQEYIDSAFGKRMTPSAIAKRQELYGWSEAERERRIFGSYILHHPIRKIAPEIQWKHLPTPSIILDTPDLAPGPCVVFGTCSAIERRVSKKGNILWAVRIADERAELESLFMDNSIDEQQRTLLEGGGALDMNCVLRGQLSVGERAFVWGRNIDTIHPTMEWIDIECTEDQIPQIVRICNMFPGERAVVMRVMDETGITRRVIIPPEAHTLTISPDRYDELLAATR